VRRLRLLLGAALLFVGAALLGRSRLTRVAVSGHSMEPTLLDGDWLLVQRRPIDAAAGDIVVALDPRDRDRIVIKRVRSVGTDSELVLESDHPAHADEVIGPLPVADVFGRVWLRYWPPSRVGLVRG
jgi:SOS-response transcriptional repressor LexA